MLHVVSTIPLFIWLKWFEAKLLFNWTEKALSIRDEPAQLKPLYRASLAHALFSHKICIVFIVMRRQAGLLDQISAQATRISGAAQPTFSQKHITNFMKFSFSFFSSFFFKINRNFHSVPLTCMVYPIVPGSL